MTKDEVKMIPEEIARMVADEERCRRKRGAFWLTKEGRDELRETFDNHDDGNAVRPLLDALEAAERERDEAQARFMSVQFWEDKIQAAEARAAMAREEADALRGALIELAHESDRAAGMAWCGPFEQEPISHLAARNRARALLPTPEAT